MFKLKRSSMQALLLLAVLWVLAPFATLTMNANAVGEVRGLQLLTGTRISTSGFSPSETSQPIPPQPSLIVAFLLGVVCLIGASGEWDETKVKFLAISTACIALCLLAFQMRAPEAIQRASENMFSLSVGFGYWCSLIVYLLITALCCVEYLAMRKRIL